MFKEEQEKLLKKFLMHVKAKGHREQGITGLRSRVPKLFVFLAERDLRMHELGVKEALEYQGWLLETGKKTGEKYCNNTILSYLGAASVFCQYLKQRGILLCNPFKEIRKVRGDRKIPRNLLKENELDHFLCELARFEQEKDLKNKIIRYRVHVIAELLYSTGLRISEAAALQPEDIDFHRGTVSVREGKGGKSRIVFLNDYAREILRIYVEKMRDLVFSEWNERNGELLFGVQWAWLLHVVNKTLNRAARASGTGRFTAHGFRHCLGYHLLRAGCSIRYIQQILGHELLRNTEIYTKVEKEDLKKVLDTYHPRQWERTGNGKTVT